MDDLLGFIIEATFDIAASNMGCGAKLITFAATVTFALLLVWFLHQK